MSVYKFEPIYKERIWGGHKFNESFGAKLCPNTYFGESWNLVDREGNESKTSINEELFTIRDLIQKDPLAIMGPNWHTEDRFPILVKWLDCRERLSLQVHPPAEVAAMLNGEPKTENWYIVESESKSGIFLGLKKQVNKSTFEAALKRNDAEKLCHWTETKPHDSVLVESGRMHAIDAGNLILEIQQNSDTTYRVYDWGRVGADGKPRNLHIEKSLKCIDFNDNEPQIKKTSKKEGIITIAESEHFRIRKINLQKASKFPIKQTETDCCIINPVEGEINIEDLNLKPGYTALSPFQSACEIQALEDSTILITDHFAGQIHTAN